MMLTPAKQKSTKALPDASNILPDEMGLFFTTIQC